LAYRENDEAPAGQICRGFATQNHRAVAGSAFLTAASTASVEGSECLTRLPPKTLKRLVF
jgi:hypothetical protein